MAAPPPARIELDALHAAIRVLEPTGPSGFEGFVRDLLGEVTGQGFRIMKSGPQGGVDVFGDAAGSGLAIGTEAKHYGAGTHLPLDALKSKLRDAAGQLPGLDVWLLAATRSVSAGDALALEQVGQELGIDVLVLDWEGHTAGLAALAVLCAAAPNAAAVHLGSEPAVTAGLKYVVAHGSFGRELSRLRERLTSPLVGYGAARHRSHAWLRARMRDPASARSEFDSRAAIEAPGVRRVIRGKITAALDGWWNEPCANPMAVLGEEGVGKTWAILSWWLEAERTNPDFPLTLVLPARDVDRTDGPTVISNALFKVTGIRDPDFWRRRLRRWTSGGPSGPMLLVIVDGLNQNWMFKQWSELFLSLASADWAGRTALAFTCRPDYWTARLKKLADLAPLALPATTSVERFDDGELDQLLALHGLARLDFSPEVLKLIRVARLCDVAIRRRDELRESGDVTPERLIYEDWLHRHHGARQIMSDEEFRDFITRLGQQTLAQTDYGDLSRADLLERLSGDTGEPTDTFEGILSEIIDGGWLAATGKPHRFRLRPDRVAHVLGLALLDEVRSSSDEKHAKQHVEELLEPHNGSDVSVAMLRCAFTFATLDPGTPAHVRRAVLSVWLAEQNFTPADFESFWRLVGCAPDVVLDIAEAAWFGHAPSGRPDEVLSKGIGNAWRWTEVQVAVERRLTDWMSRYWLDPLDGEVLGKVPDDGDAAARRDVTGRRADGWRAREPTCGLDITVEEHAPDRQAWGRYRALELLSWLPRAPLIRPLTAWALTRAVMDSWSPVEPFAWLLRWNPHDPAEAEAAVLAMAETLAAIGHEVADASAMTLLASIATKASSDLAGMKRTSRFVNGDVGLGESATMGSSQVTRSANSEAMGAWASARDPSAELTDQHMFLLRTAGEAMTRGSGATDGCGASRVLLALARWAPEVRANIERSRVSMALPQGLPSAEIEPEAMAHAPEPELDALASNIASALLVTLEPDLAACRSWAAWKRDQGSAWDDRLQAVGFAGQEASDQIKFLSQAPPGSRLPDWIRPLASPPTLDDFVELSPRLDPAMPVSTLTFWLDYLIEAPTAGMPPGWSALGALFKHPETSVRSKAIRIAVKAQDPSLAASLRASGWAYHSEMDRDEAAVGSLLLSRVLADPDSGVAAIIHPEAAGYLLDRYPEEVSYLEAFSRHVREELHELTTATSRTYPRALLAERKGWDVIAAKMPSDLHAWLEPFTNSHNAEKLAHFSFTEAFPLLEGLRALDRLEPGASGRYFSGALDRAKYISIRFGALYSEALKSPGQAGDAAKLLALNEANNDKKLFDFVLGLQKSGQSGWLIEHIRGELSDRSSGIIARAMILAGFLDSSTEADALWTECLSEPPAEGWLATVHESARSSYRRNAWSRHWYEVFRISPSEDAAFAAHELFVATVDSRVYLDERRPNGDEVASWPWRKRAHWGLNWSRVVKDADERLDDLARLFLATEPPLPNQHPRRR